MGSYPAGAMVVIEHGVTQKQCGGGEMHSVTLHGHQELYSATATISFPWHFFSSSSTSVSTRMETA